VPLITPDNGQIGFFISPGFGAISFERYLYVIEGIDEKGDSKIQ
jgi:hypothetical protein